MFENITVRKSMLLNSSNLDVGAIAESLLFYHNVHLAFDYGTLQAALRDIGPDQILRLLDGNFIKMTFVRDSAATITSARPIGNLYGFMTAELKGGQHKKERYSKTDVVEQEFIKSLGRSRRTTSYFKKILPQMAFRRLGDNCAYQGGLTRLAQNDLENASYVHRAIEGALDGYLPGFSPPPGWSFVVIPTDQGIMVDTDLDFQEINKKFKASQPNADVKIDIATLLSMLHEARIDIHFSGEYMSDVVTMAPASNVMKIRLQEITNLRRSASHHIESFQDVTLGNGRALREVLASGERKFSEFVDLLEKSKKFRSWVSGVNPDVGLLRAYVDSVSSESWLENMPTKFFRWIIVAPLAFAADHVAPLLGSATITAADSFLLKRLAEGWRPNQFVQGPLASFVRK